MTETQKTKKEETRRRILEAAISLMEELGLASVQIRAVAKKADYSIGSVYKHFADIDDLISAVNGITLDRVANAMDQAVRKESAPLARLKALAHAYLSFASENPKLWRGLFDHHLPEGKAIPDDHKERNIALLAFISREIAILDPQLGSQELDARSRTCFAAVHGLVTFNMEGRFIGLSGSGLEREMDYLVERLTLPTN